MFTVTGVLIGKTLLKEGVTEKGTWKIVQFLLQKTKNKKPIKLPFTAKGKLAEKIEDIAVGQRVTVEFFINGTQYKDKWFPDVIATDIDKYVPKKKYEHGSVSYGNELFEDKEVYLKEDLQLFRKEQ